MNAPKKPRLWQRLSLRGRLLAIMLSTALAATLLCSLVLGLAFARTTAISQDLQETLTSNVHFMLEMLINQQEVHIKDVYVQHQSAFLDDRLAALAASGQAPDWPALLADAYTLINTTVQHDNGPGVLDSIMAVQFIYTEGQVFAHAGFPVDSEAFLASVDAFYRQDETLVNFYTDLAESDSFDAYVPGENGAALLWRPFAEGAGRIGMLVPLTTTQASGALRELMTSEGDAAAKQSAQAVTWAATVLLIFLVTISIALYFISRRLSNDFVTPVERELRQAAEEKELMGRLDKLKTEFLGNVSHELKAPLTVMSGYAQTSELQLAAQPENEAVASKMKLISAEAERLALMVGQLLDVTRIEEGRMALSLQPCHVDEIIQSAVDTHFPILNKNSNRLRLQITSDLPKINADSARLTQVIVNLIANAIRFTTDGDITISAQLNGRFVQVSVADTGCGIESERLPTIFDRYSHSKSPAGQKNTGTGLGLYICKHIVEGHGGKIRAESTVGRGTTFTFTVPLADQGQ